MNRTQIMNAFKSLARSQGFYGRLVNYLESLDSDSYNEKMTALENQKFKDVVDLVMYIEC